ncbi:MAG TPA: HNH endonuclease, partial [Ktedonobacterales bacterium]|nr:HNH endonuclease [Ktedonobacterales bacterium]
MTHPDFSMGSVAVCSVCREVIPEREAQASHGSAETPYAVDGNVCAGCASAALTFHRVTCPLCGIVGHRLGNFIAISVSDSICQMCATAYHVNSEHIRVTKQVLRARKAGLAATLTTLEWLQTLIDFGGRCAYCSGPFDDLEHFLPISRGGGTTAQNCVPACRYCNGSKDHPQNRRLSPDALAFVGAYLDGWTARNPVTGMRVGQVCPILRRYGGDW